MPNLCLDSEGLNVSSQLIKAFPMVGRIEWLLPSGGRWDVSKRVLPLHILQTMKMGPGQTPMQL